VEARSVGGLGAEHRGAETDPDPLERTGSRTLASEVGPDGAERQGGNGRSDAVRLSTRGNLRRVRKRWRGTGPRPTACSQGQVHDGIRGNPADPRSGTGLQYARDLQVEEAVEVVRNHEGGTGRDGVAAVTRREVASAIFREWTPAGRRPRRLAGVAPEKGRTEGRIPGEDGGLRTPRSVPGALRTRRRRGGGATDVHHGRRAPRWERPRSCHR